MVLGVVLWGSPQFKRVECFTHVLTTLDHLSYLHRFGPYNNFKDRCVHNYIGLPLFYLCNTDQIYSDAQLLCEVGDKRELNIITCVEDVKQPVITDNHNVAERRVSNDENVGSTVVYNNRNLCFDHTLGFVTQQSSSFIASHTAPLNMQDSKAYLSLVSDILSSGLPNYHSVHVPLPSAFNWDYLQEYIESYHDDRLMDYLQFGFPLGIRDPHLIAYFLLCSI